MSKVILSLASVAEIDDGRVAEAFNNCLKEATADIARRSNEKKERVVALSVGLSPILNESSQLLGFATSVKFKVSLPDRKSRAFEMGLTPEGQAYFESNHPEDLRQMTIEDAEDKAALKKLPAPVGEPESPAEVDSEPDAKDDEAEGELGD